MHFLSWTGAGVVLSRLLLLLALTVSFAPPVVDAACANVVQRKEWRQLSPAEQATFIDAVKALQARQSPTQPSSYDKLVQLHIALSTSIHSTAAFLPWHRFYLLLFEKALQKVSNNKNLALPYWNWGMDSQTLDLSAIWDSDPRTGFGGNGDSNADYCVRDGAFSNWRPIYPDPHCLRRNWAEPNRAIAIYGTDLIDILVRTTKNYAAFRPALEGPPHSSVHLAVGGMTLIGDMALMHSPNDPLFWLHHCFVDKIWAEWQSQHRLFTDYSGPKVKLGPSDATLDDPLPGFSFKKKDTGQRVVILARHVMNIDSLCYSYVNPDLTVLTGGGEAAPLIRRRSLLLRRSPLPIPEPSLKNPWRWGQVQALDDGIDDDDDDPADDALVRVYDSGLPSHDELTPCSRKYLNLILPPPRLPDTWIKMNGHNIDDIRRMEDDNYAKIDKLNSLDDYVSPDCAINQPWMLARLVGQVGTFIYYNRGKKIEVQYNEKDSLKAMRGIIRRCKKHCPGKRLQKQPDEIADKLRPIFGDYRGDKNRLDNVWRPRTYI